MKDGLRFAVFACLVAGTCFSTVAMAATMEVESGDKLTIDGERLRIANIDAPEPPPNSLCEDEDQAGAEAKKMLVLVMSLGPATVQRTGNKDRFSRNLALISVDGKDVGEIMVRAGWAIFADGKDTNWCPNGTRRPGEPLRGPGYPKIPPKPTPSTRPPPPVWH